MTKQKHIYIYVYIYIYTVPQYRTITASATVIRAICALSLCVSLANSHIGLSGAAVIEGVNVARPLYPRIDDLLSHVLASIAG